MQMRERARAAAERLKNAGNRQHAAPAGSWKESSAWSWARRSKKPTGSASGEPDWSPLRERLYGARLFCGAVGMGSVTYYGYEQSRLEREAAALQGMFDARLTIKELQVGLDAHFFGRFGLSFHLVPSFFFIWG